MDIYERAKDFGPLGRVLIEHIESCPDIVSDFRETFIGRLIKLTNSANSLRTRSYLLPAAVSLLCLDFPLQEDMTFASFLRWVREAYDLNIVDSPAFGESDLAALPPGRLVRRLCRSKLRLASAFPEPELLAGQTKPNMKLGPLISSSVIMMGSERVAALLRSSWNMRSDRVMSKLVYAFVLSRRFGEVGHKLANFLVNNPDDAKYISLALKALGLNSTDWGSVLCEANTLAGRGTGGIDLAREAAQRCDRDFVDSHIVHVDPDELRPHVKSILDRELKNIRSMAPLDDFWTSRWLWCVNGSQTTESSLALGIDPHYCKATHKRAYRRSASEHVKNEPITSWDGRTSVSVSAKLEAGKTRAIFACDTRSYFAFSWILSAAQRDWANSRVLLDPGVGGHLGMFQRISRAQRGGGVNLMLDYDDFNSQHSTSSMQVVFDELCSKYNCPSWYRDTLVGSFEKMFVNCGNERKRVLGTLMSGHRGTTFINSVLNAAYIRLAIGGSKFDRLLSLHTGDDVYIRANTLADCVHILDSTKELGCRMNPTKQSIGYKGAEFLRMGMRQDDCFGYFTRALSSFVSGNWANTDSLDPVEGLRSAIGGCRSMINRGQVSAVAELVGPAPRYRPGLGARTLCKMLKCEIAIVGSPVFGGSGFLTTYRVTTRVEDRIRVDKRWARYATGDYLAHHTTSIEAAALEMSGSAGTNLLIISSYVRGLNEERVQPKPAPSWKKLPRINLRGYACASDLVNKQRKRGVLSHYPLINLIKNRLDEAMLRTLIAEELGYVPEGEPYKIAFGEDSNSKRILGVLSYADASAYCSRTDSGSVYTLCRVAM
ncbi:RNA directed RNA polymerase [Ustilaginoidea virens RNA virus L]|uniref:RNA-directed RNA polymerase n=3 Tax=Orthornavirae TaxID=2732396 RepID=A0A097I5B7_9VIRU|nr:RNA directed RNA polymerase [Ustilaginoidea virens RNA virus L]AIT56394.1 RNA directed RNA polymerase [Ustilaginoidea virens RNA virus L]